MGRYEVTGKNRIVGELEISGSKNGTLPILAAVMLASGECVIHNCPNISDVQLTLKILQSLGCKVSIEKNTVTIDSSFADKTDIPIDDAVKTRSSVLFLGSLLGRFKEAKLPYPGGCAIGSRPIDLHIHAASKMGAIFEDCGGCVSCKASRLLGTYIIFDFPSVGATENTMLMGAMAKGETVICNAAKEPEIIELQNFINAMGGKIRGAGTDTIYIVGTEKLHGCEYHIGADRIEAATFLAAAAITKGDIYLKNANPDFMRYILMTFEEIGCIIDLSNSGIRLKAPKALRSIEKIRTQPYPAFPTDAQPQVMSILTLAEGTSIIIETMFESRFGHVNELCAMGADIVIEGKAAIIKGVERLLGARVFARDLRGGAALILAGLAAEGVTIVENSFYVERGYENIHEKLRSVGGEIKYLI